MDEYNIIMTYRNWRGEIAERTIRPFALRFGSTDWHPEPGWLLSAHDVEKGEPRDFALADCQFSDLTAPATDTDTADLVARLKNAALWASHQDQPEIEALLNDAAAALSAAYPVVDAAMKKDAHHG